MLKRMLALLLCLLLAFPVLAEDVPTLPGLFTLDALPEGLTFDVYTGPGMNYHQAAKGKAKVSTNGPIQCYGRIGDTGWVLIRYEVSSSQLRVGCIDLQDYPDMWRNKREVALAEDILHLPAPVKITDDPYRNKNPLGTVSGVVTLLAWRGIDYAYVEGFLDGTGECVRGFIPRAALNGAAPMPDMAMSPFAGDRFALEKSYALNLPGDAQAEGMTLYPLADGSWLIAYHCESRGTLWMRVISERGKKLWAKSVDERYLGQITLTETGFLCEVFDNSKIDSGMRYTYTCKGKKWASQKITWIGEPDRYYSDNTAGYTVRRYPFCEGSTIRTTVTNRITGAEAEHLMSIYAGSRWYLHEADGELYFYARDEHAVPVVRIYGEDAEELFSIPVPADMPLPHKVVTADHARNAVYFFTEDGVNWQLWRLDRETLSFADTPVTIAVPYGCTGLIALSANASGMHDVLMQTVFGSYFCQLTPDGTMLLHQALPGRVVWITRLEDARLMLVLQDSGGDFHLQYYNVCEG